jgi:hypothetical protein
LRLDGDGKALNDVYLSLTPDEAKQVIAGLQSLLADERVAAEGSNHTHVADGVREITLTVYTDPSVETQHDDGFRFLGPAKPLDS